ncbi:CPBP family intramembrane glutamic endopeptidase [Sphingomonas sp. UYAg733]
MAIPNQPAHPPSDPRQPLVVIGALAGLAVAGVIIAFGPMLVEATGLAGDPHSPAWDESLFTAAIFGGLLLAAAIGGAVTRVRTFALGARALATLAVGAALGLAGILTATIFGWIAGSLNAPTDTASAGGTILLGIAVVLLQVVAEEVYFRGWLQPLLARACGLRVAVPLVATGFAALHVLGGARDSLSLLNLLLGGLAFGLLAAHAGGIAPAIGMHLAWNGTEQLVLGLDPNPGLGSFGALFDLDLVGSPWWGGSTDGLNGSLGMSVALLAILASLIVYTRRLA